MTRKIKVIGAGGIGGYLLEPLARYLSYTGDNCEMTIIDGDDFENRNRERQRYASNLSNKADAAAEMLRGEFPKVHIRVKEEYINESNVISTIREKDIVFMCVDNHATRKVVSDRCCELDDVLLISGGNDYIDGDVLIHWRKGGKDITPPITKTAPEINTPKDKIPGTNENREGCQEQAAASPQLLFMNLDIASCMLSCYYAYDQNKLSCKRILSDISTFARRAVGA